MKKLILLLITIGLSVSLMAQNQKEDTSERINPVRFCQDPYLHDEMVEYNGEFLNQAFSLEVFKVVPVKKKTYVPTVIKLEKGQLYQINIVANRDFKDMTVILVGKGDDQIYKEHYKGDAQMEHWFTKSVVAPFTGEYLVVVSQNVKGKKFSCVGVSVMKSGGN